MRNEGQGCDTEDRLCISPCPCEHPVLTIDTAGHMMDKHAIHRLSDKLTLKEKTEAYVLTSEDSQVTF